ncbi:MAG TPA: TadE/TadG family type IV pilus assembly protein [Blastocatellia bacterium]|nr:TadE/TadG family type IV pilus assembly protein [Blastocatellia bacterium]
MAGTDPDRIGRRRFPHPGPSLRSQRGNSMVEMAILLPMFLIVILGTVEIGRVWWLRQAVTNAAREGARAATQHANDCHAVSTLSAGRQAARNSLALAGLDTSDATAQIDFLPGFNTGADGAQLKNIRVRITYHFDSLIPFLTSLVSEVPAPGEGDQGPRVVTENVTGCEP